MSAAAKRAVALLALCAAMVVCAPSGLAEGLSGVDVSLWESAAESGLNAKALLESLTRGDEIDFYSMFGEFRDRLAAEAKSLLPSLLALTAPALIWALSKRLLGGGTLAGALSVICALAESAVLMGLFRGELERASEAARRLGAVGDAIYPALAALLAAAGGAGSAASLTSGAQLIGAFWPAIREASRALTMCAAALAVAGNIGGEIKVKGLFSLARAANGWLLGASVTIFTGVTAAFGLLGSSRDGASLRAAKYTVDNLLPVIGGEVKDTVESVAASAALVRSAAGVTGAALMLSICLWPIVRIALAIAACQVAAALSEPLDGGPPAECLRQFSQVLQMALAALAACVALDMTLLGAALRASAALSALG